MPTRHREARSSFRGCLRQKPRPLSHNIGGFYELAPATRSIRLAARRSVANRMRRAPGLRQQSCGADAGLRGGQSVQRHRAAPHPGSPNRLAARGGLPPRPGTSSPAAGGNGSGCRLGLSRCRADLSPGAETRRTVEKVGRARKPAAGDKQPAGTWEDLSAEKWTVKLGGHVQTDYVTWANADEPPIPAQNYFEFRRLRLWPTARATGFTTSACR